MKAGHFGFSAVVKSQTLWALIFRTFLLNNGADLTIHKINAPLRK